MSKSRHLVRFALLAVIAAAAFFVLRTADPTETVQTALVPPPPPEPVVTYDSFGFEEGRFVTHDARIARNQTFSEILATYALAREHVYRLAEASEEVFDVRYLQAGKPYRMYVEDSTARYLVYRPDAVRYVVFDLDPDAPTVYEGARRVELRQREVSGQIASSLYQTLREKGADPTLAFDLAEVYAWQIDFYRIQRGDFFKVIYEEKVVDGDVIGTGDILAARFNHGGDDYYAFLYDQDGKKEHFDEQGGSLRKAFLKAPVKYSRVSSGYTMRRFHPVQKRWKAHLGTDFAAPRGTPIVSTGDGVVVEAGRRGGNGIYVKVRHNATYTTGYLHMSKLGEGIKKGVRVHQGDVIGYVGSTGLATGPHVCYRFWKNGRQVDSRKETFPSSNPVQEQHRVAYDAVKATFMEQLHDEPLPQFANGVAASPSPAS